LQVEGSSSAFGAVATRRLFVLLLFLGFLLRLGYGAVRYRGNLVKLSGTAFIGSWDHDALVHVSIARALLAGRGYIVDDTPLPGGKLVPDAGKVALFKAPLYEYFLAGVFAVSGFSFKLFFPLQALAGGLVSGIVGAITLQTFRRPSAAWFAGILATIHPILVNSASQPYNENVFYFFFVLSIWAFFGWIETTKLAWAISCGAAIGLCTLTRENGTLLLAAMGFAVLISVWNSVKSWTGYGVIALSTVAVILPWTIHNYVEFSVFVPVASITGEDLLQGNNACVAAENAFTSFWAEGSCHWVDEQRRAVPQTAAMSDSRVPDVVLRDRESRAIALRFILNQPASYVKLAFRRFWTTLLPYDPRGSQHTYEKTVLSLYWVLLFPAGITGMVLAFKGLKSEPGRVLLGSLILLNILSIAAVLYWSDLRFRVGIDLPLACFAGSAYAKSLGAAFGRGSQPC
jgi:4-amino-4-deoxy-L-arabinose transferase-like glycosyltransferase